MKDIYIILTIIILLILYIIWAISSSKNNLKTQNKPQSRSKNLRNVDEDFQDQDIDDSQTYGDLICKLQKKYSLGFEDGTYIPVPKSEQPNNALPFNPGLEPCKLRLY